MGWLGRAFFAGTSALYFLLTSGCTATVQAEKDSPDTAIVSSQSLEDRLRAMTVIKDRFRLPESLQDKRSVIEEVEMPLFRDEELIRYLSSSGEKFRIVQRLYAIKDERGRRMFDDEKWYKEFMDGGWDPKLAEALGKLKKKNGETIFWGNSIIKYLRAGGTLRYARDFLATGICDYDTDILLHKGFDIVECWEAKVPISYIKATKIKTRDVLDEKEELLLIASQVVKLWKAGVPAKFVVQLGSLKTEYGSHIYQYHDEIIKAHKAGLDTGFAKAISGIRNPEGEVVFSRPRDILRAYEDKLPVEFARKEAAKIGKDGKPVYRFLDAGRILTRYSIGPHEMPMEREEARRLLIAMDPKVLTWDAAITRKTGSGLFPRLPNEPDPHDTTDSRNDDHVFYILKGTPNVTFRVIDRMADGLFPYDKDGLIDVIEVARDVSDPDRPYSAIRYYLHRYDTSSVPAEQRRALTERYLKDMEERRLPGQRRYLERDARNRLKRLLLNDLLRNPGTFEYLLQHPEVLKEFLPDNLAPLLRKHKDPKYDKPGKDEIILPPYKPPIQLETESVIEV